MDKQDAEAQPTQLEIERHRLMEQLHLPIERLPLAYMLFDKNNRVLNWNIAAEKIFGYSKEEAVGRVALDLILPLPLSEHVQDVLRRVQSVDMDAHGVNENRTKDGRIIICEWFNTPLMDSDGRYAGAISLAQDITQRVQTEERLRDSEERINRILKSITDGMVTLDHDWCFTYINAQAERALGRDRSHLLGKCVWVEYPANLGTEVERQLRQVAVKQITGEYQGHDPVQDRWYDNRVFPMPDGGVAIYFRDITARKRAEDAVRCGEAQLAEAQQLAHVGSWNWDIGTGAFTWSDEHYRIFGFNPQDTPITLDRAWARVHPEDRAAVETLFARAVENGQSYESTFRLLHEDRAVRVVQSRGQVDVDTAGKAVRAYGTIQDITERKRAEEEARVANERLDLAIRGSNIGIWDLDLAPENDYRDVPVRFINVWEPLGYDPVEFPSDASASRALGHPDDLARVDAAVAACLAREVEEIRVENRIRHKDGSDHWLLTLGKAVRDASGRPVRLIGTVSDITDRKHAEEALRRSESLLAEAQQVAHIGSWNWDMLSDTVTWSDEHYRIFGLRPHEMPMTYNGFLRLVHPDDRATVQNVVANVLRDHLPFDYCLRALHKDGTIRVVQSRGRAVFAEGGKPIRMYGTVQDVTERASIEAALRESEERFRHTFENAAVGIAHMGEDCHYLCVNQTLCDILGYSRDELIGTSCQQLTHPDDLTVGIDQFLQVMRGELQSFSAEKRYRHKNGSPVWVDMSVSLQRNTEGEPAYAIEVIEDISERKRLEVELRRAKEAAEMANRSKNEFLANVSHEIRTPLNAILGLTELVLDSELMDDQRQDLATVLSAGENLLGVVTDLLDFSKIEAGKLELHPTDFDLRATVRDVLKALVVRAHRKGLELAYHIESEVPDVLTGDAVRLRQVLLNLVGNAIKFTEIGNVTVRVELVHSMTGDEPALRFHVSDTGIGIPLDRQQIIFQAFEQEDASRTRKYGGTGLGLTISARLVAMMGGEITVKSALGRGSTFTFTASFMRQSELIDPATPHRLARPGVPNLLISEDVKFTSRETVEAPKRATISLRVLVAEDNEFNVRQLERLLRRHGHDVRLAANGRETLKALQISDPESTLEQLQPETRVPVACAEFDVLLLDLHMPELDGFDVIKAIRDHERSTGGHLPVIALTARTRKEDHDECLAAGMDEYLSKPVQSMELYAAIERLVAAPKVSATKPINEAPDLIDPGVLLAACGNDAGLLYDLCQDFQEFAPARLAEVSDALRAQDAPQLSDATHTLCGLLCAFSTVAGNTASELETCAAAGQLQQAASLVESVDNMVQAILAEIKDLSVENMRHKAATAND